jgi:hypothetical protein
VALFATGYVPYLMIVSAAILYGAAWAIGGLTLARLGAPGAVAPSEPMLHPVAFESQIVTAGAKLYVGLAVLALGILALVGFLPAKLLLIAFLSLGAAYLLNGLAVGGKRFSVYLHRKTEART